MTQQVIGFTGYAQSGKDSAAAFLIEKGFVRLSFADILRESLYKLNPIVDIHREAVREGWGRLRTIVDEIGWDAAKVKYAEIRQLLQRLGTDVGRELYGEDFWVEIVMKQMKSGGRYVISDVRFPNEVKAVKALGGNVYRIHRAGTGAVNNHVSDTGVDRLWIDGVIPNHGTIEQFREMVLATTGVELRSRV